MPGQVTLSFVAATEFYESPLAATPVLVKSTAATWFIIEIDNSLNTATTYFKGWYASAASSVTLGTTVADIVLGVPSGQKVDFICPTGNAGVTGLVVACVTGRATSSSTAPAASVTVRIAYN